MKIKNKIKFKATTRKKVKKKIKSKIKPNNLSINGICQANKTTADRFMNLNNNMMGRSVPPKNIRMYSSRALDLEGSRRFKRPEKNLKRPAGKLKEKWNDNRSISAHGHFSKSTRAVRKNFLKTEIEGEKKNFMISKLNKNLKVKKEKLIIQKNNHFKIGEEKKKKFVNNKDKKKKVQEFLNKSQNSKPMISDNKKSLFTKYFDKKYLSFFQQNKKDTNSKINSKLKKKRKKPRTFLKPGHTYSSISKNDFLNSKSQRIVNHPFKRPEIRKKPKKNLIDEVDSIDSENMEGYNVENIIIKRNKIFKEFKNRLINKCSHNENFSKVVGMIQKFFNGTFEDSWLLSFQTLIEFYDIKSRVGRGSFGEVLLVVNRLTNKNMAMKKISKQIIREKEVESKIQREIKILKNVNNHPNVVRLYEVFEDEDYYYMIFEFLRNGDISMEKLDMMFPSQTKLKQFFYKVLMALKYVHNKSVIHRDIKLENILLDENWDPKIADFGISSIFTNLKKITDTGGTPRYLAPEVIKSEGEIGFKTDVWSLGILLCMLVFKQAPFYAKEVQDLYNKIINQPFEICSRALQNSKKSDEFEDLLKRMLIKDPKDRISLNECINHPWFNSIRGGEPESNSERKKVSISQFVNFPSLFPQFAQENCDQNQSDLFFPFKESILSYRNIQDLDIKNKQFNFEKSMKTTKKKKPKKVIKPPKKKVFVRDMNVFFDSSTHANIKDCSKGTTKHTNFSEEQINALKSKAVIDYLIACGFPEKFIFMIITEKDKQFTHLKLCFDVLFESLEN